MKFYIAVKKLGKQKEPITKKEFICSSSVTSLRDLMTFIIKEEVHCYRHKAQGMEITPYLSKAEIEEKLAAGKVTFEEVYLSKEVHLDEALERAFLAFEDGLIRVLVGEEEIKNLDAPLDLKDEEMVVFIRLMMLSGRF
ncbi:MAG: hypothetical protein GX198_01120 [Epulopiscium sp.]|nr:hypothetical protein [Candidatus Epulonipiscium sp.]